LAEKKKNSIKSKWGKMAMENIGENRKAGQTSQTKEGLELRS
jgi:hypothetical protein